MKAINKTIQVALITVLMLGASTFATAQSKSDYKQEVKELKSQLEEIVKANEIIAQNLKTFDELDFEVFTNEEWTRLHESHTEDILVHWPDGHTTKGIKKHIEDLSAMFVYAPDTRIEEHPLRIASGNLTAVLGVIEGTFTEPMPIGEGNTIPPTGKAYKLNMVTIGLWNEDGQMYEEYLFWDNLAFMQQLGLAQ